MEPLNSRRLLSASIAGLWVGSRTESGLSGTFATVTIDLNLTQSGSAITGNEHRSSPKDSEYFADMVTGGTFDGSTFSMQDQSITASKRPSDYKWLLYTATLRLSPDGQTLSGGWHASGKHGSMTLQRVPLPRLTLTSAGPAGAGGGVTLHYTIDTARVAHRLRFDLYRSTQPHRNATSQFIGTQTLSAASRPTMLTIGSHHVTLLSALPLSGNKKRPYVIIVANADNAVLESADSIDSVFFKLTSF